MFGLFADFRRDCTSKKLGRSPERPLSSNCPVSFACAAKVRNPPKVSLAMSALGWERSLLITRLLATLRSTADIQTYDKREAENGKKRESH